MALTFQELILNLSKFWSDYGCIIQQPYDIEKGASTMNPATFLRSLGPEPWNTAMVEPCRRPTDARYGENPNRLGHYFQYQVILKPSPDNAQQLILKRLEAMTCRSMMSDLLKTTGSLPPSVQPVWAGKYGWMEWKSPSLRIFNRWAVWKSSRLRLS